MQTDVLTPMAIFSMPQHLTVPVFQRRYVWTAENQWEPLWRDICRVAERRLEGVSSQHFLGAVVTQASPAGMGSLASHGLIDGQQRLTTLQLLVDAAAAELDNADQAQFAQQLAMLTHNPVAFGFDETQLLKLQHENDDRAGFVAVMTAEPPIDYSSLPQSRVVQAHQYFSEQVREWLGDPVDPTRAAALVATLTQGLQLVVIALAEHEPSQEIFETLNARGTPLTAADLVKNYVFQQIVQEGGSAETAFREHWRDLEKPFWTKEVRIGRYSLERLSLFLNHWLVAQTGEEVSTRSTFTRFKSWHESSGRAMTQVLDSIHRQAQLFENWVRESGRTDGDLDQVPLFLYRTEAADLEAVKPILLRLFDVERPVPNDVATEALRDVESWLMRRSILRRPASEYSRVVANLIDDLRGAEPTRVSAALRESLIRLNRPGTYWPGDEEMKRELATAPIYKQPKGRLRAYLEAVEDWQRGYTKKTSASGSRVKRGAMTIEHLLPQKWAGTWPVDTLQQQIDRDAHVHRLGNLTLLTQSLNSSVSNGSWNGPKRKREALKASDTLLMSRGPRDTADWNEERIDERTGSMTHALLETWTAPEGHNPEPVKRTEQEAAVWVEIRDLVASGHLAAGTVLHAREGDYQGRCATVTADGRLEMDGKTYDTPSGAGKEVLGRTVNGWSFWRLPEGGKLMDVRQKYLGTYVDRKGLYEAFWGEVLERIKKAEPDWTQASSPGSSSWMPLPYGSSVARYVLSFTITGPTIDLEFASADREANMREYERFLARREELERTFGEPLSWEPLEDKKSCRIRCYRKTSEQVTDVANHEDLTDWFVSSARRFRSSAQAIKRLVQEQ